MRRRKKTTRYHGPQPFESVFLFGVCRKARFIDFPYPFRGPASPANPAGYSQEEKTKEEKKTSKFDNVEAESVVTYVGFPLHLCKPIVVKCKRIHVWMRYIL